MDFALIHWNLNVFYVELNFNLGVSMLVWPLVELMQCCEILGPQLKRHLSQYACFWQSTITFIWICNFCLPMISVNLGQHTITSQGIFSGKVLIIINHIFLTRILDCVLRTSIGWSYRNSPLFIKRIFFARSNRKMKCQ